MSTTTRFVNAAPDKVWQVLADGWLYPLWVVGAARIRDVDESWPQEGAKIHHSVGMWPALVDDDTEVLECKPPGMIRLLARAWPAGEAEVRITLTASGTGTEVVIEEDVVTGPATLVPELLTRPALTWRNVESLRRLAFIAENRH